MKKTISVIMLAITFSTASKAQDDPNCGFIIDGTLVDSIPNFGFNEVSIVFPITDEWKKYERIEIHILCGGESGQYYFDPMQKYLAAPALGMMPVNKVKMPDGKFWDHSFFRYSARQYKTANNDPNAGTWSDGEFSIGSAIFSESIGGYQPAFYFLVKGLTSTGIIEIPQAGGTIVKVPVYDNGVVLYKSRKIPYWYIEGRQGHLSRKQEKQAEANRKLPWRPIGKPFTFKSEPIEGTPLSIIRK